MAHLSSAVLLLLALFYASAGSPACPWGWCARRPAQGERCFRFFWECADGLQCMGPWGQQVCTKVVQLGEECNLPATSCEPKATCFSSRCFTINPVGGVCSFENPFMACQRGLTCNPNSNGPGRICLECDTVKFPARKCYEGLF